MSVVLKRNKMLHEVCQRQFNPNETMQWLQINLRSFICWGVGRPYQFANKALWFTVKGRYLKGNVLITLAWNDTYTVRFLNAKWETIKVLEQVYCSDLNEIIDNNIEKVKGLLREKV
jgi:hypothetical protein